MAYIDSSQELAPSFAKPLTTRVAAGVRVLRQRYGQEGINRIVIRGINVEDPLICPLGQASGNFSRESWRGFPDENWLDRLAWLADHAFYVKEAELREANKLWAEAIESEQVTAINLN
jgi:hypothetical protein